MAAMLRQTPKPVYLAVNKVDNHQRQIDATEFYSLGFDVIYNVSSISGSGTGEVLDAVCRKNCKADIDENAEK